MQHWSNLGQEPPSEDRILQLYPLPGGEVQLKGLYLGHALRTVVQDRGSPFVYANFIASLDGRIALPSPEDPGLATPNAIANPRDWRLFQELAAQADVLITSGRYLREHAAGGAQEILQTFDDPEFSDLKTWRQESGLPPQPDLAVISAGLDFLIPDGLTVDGREVVIITGANADPQRARALEAQFGRVITTGESRVDGRSLVDALHRLGYRLIYSTAGPQVLHTLLSAGALDRLYLTHAHRALGGRRFASILDGPLLTPPADFELRDLYFDPHAIEGHGQMLSVYDFRKPPDQDGLSS